MQANFSRLAKAGTGYSYQQTMMRIKCPKRSLEYYQTHFGMQLVAARHFPQWKFSLYFLGTFPEGHKFPFEPESDEAFTFLNQFDGTVLELTHNHGTEDDPEQKYHNGNNEPRGFGHIGFIVDDLEKFCVDLEAKGVAFKKRPHEGMMKTIAFAYDPDEYWVEILKRSKEMPPTAVVGKPSFQQTMLRIKDPKKSLPFYCDLLGMELVNELHFEQAKFSLYFLGTFKEGEKLPDDPKSAEAGEFARSISSCLLELTHNWGTESDEKFEHHSGNSEPRGFGHIGFLCDNLVERCEKLEKEHNVAFQKRPHEGNMRNIAFAKDPDGYWVELITRTKWEPKQ